MDKKRGLRWNQLGCSVVWAGPFILLLLAFLLHNLQAQEFSAILSVFPDSEPPVTIVARADLPEFTLLTPPNLAILQGRLERNLSSPDTVKQQEEAYYQRITLRPYLKGEEIQLADLGPRLPATHHYQLREINAHSALDWIHVGDTLSLILINTNCTTSSASKTNPACSFQTSTNTSLLKNVVVIEIGKTEQGGLRALLVAIPLEENASAIALLDPGQGNVVAYPVATTTGMSIARRFLVV